MGRNNQTVWKNSIWPRRRRRRPGRRATIKGRGLFGLLPNINSMLL